jgi:hypothetical protein
MKAPSIVVALLPESAKWDSREHIFKYISLHCEKLTHLNSSLWHRLAASRACKYHIPIWLDCNHRDTLGSVPRMHISAIRASLYIIPHFLHGYIHNMSEADIKLGRCIHASCSVKSINVYDCILAIEERHQLFAFVNLFWIALKWRPSLTDTQTTISFHDQTWFAATIRTRSHIDWCRNQMAPSLDSFALCPRFPSSLHV